MSKLLLVTGISQYEDGIWSLTVLVYLTSSFNGANVRTLFVSIAGGKSCERSPGPDSWKIDADHACYHGPYLIHVHYQVSGVAHSIILYKVIHRCFVPDL